MDKLESIFEIQAKLQKRLKVKYNQQYREKMILACFDELAEVLRETPWKPWKKNQDFNKEKFEKELADLLHFFVNLCLSCDITANYLYDLYINKNKVNIQRQENGY